MNFQYLYFLFWLSCLVLFSTCARSGDEPPNIIYILADDLGYGDVGAFNPESQIPTPHLDRLAAEGMRFADAHTSSSVCTPTRYGILTGRYNWRSPLKSGVLWGESPALIPNDRKTVASLLKENGYYTAFIGKWHLGWDWGRGEDGTIDFAKAVKNNPNDLGFDYAYGHAASLDIPPYVYVENGMPTAVPDSMIPATESYGFYREGWIAPDFKMEEVTPNFFERAMEVIEQQAKAENPFFLYLALPSPHTPILPTKAWQGKSSLNPYGDFVMMIDDYIGQLTSVIKKAGIDESTLVIFTSDNGCSPMANFEVLAEKGHDPSYHFRGHKADIFEGGHRVPFIAKWPQRIRSGSTSAQTICTTDLMATCAELTGVELNADEGEDSFSLLSLFGNPDGGYGRSFTIHHSINGSFAIRQGDWKLILCPGSGGWSSPTPEEAKAENLPPLQLYNLATDAGETNNLAEAHPEKVKDLYQRLMNSVETGRSTTGMEQTNEAPLKGEWKQLNTLKELEKVIFQRK